MQACFNDLEPRDADSTFMTWLNKYFLSIDIYGGGVDLNLSWWLISLFVMILLF